MAPARHPFNTEMIRQKADVWKTGPPAGPGAADAGAPAVDEPHAAEPEAPDTGDPESEFPVRIVDGEPEFPVQIIPG